MQMGSFIAMSVYFSEALLNIEKKTVITAIIGIPERIMLYFYGKRF